MSKSMSQRLLGNLKTRKGTIITKGEMQGLKKRWNKALHLRACNRATPVDVEAEQEAFENATPFLVSPEQTEQGLKWWKQMVFKPNGEVRNTEFVRHNMTDYRIDVLRRFHHFEFVGWENIYTSGGYGSTYPMYKVVALKGRKRDSFVYTMRGWQSGGSIVEG